MDSAQSTLNNKNEIEPQAVVVRREAERELLKWTAAARPFKRRDKQFFVTVFSIAGIIGLVLFFAEGVMPVLLIIALIFLYYVLSTVPPDDIEYQITTRGVKVAGKLTSWDLLHNFWFGTRLGSDMLFFETYHLPGKLEIVINPELKEKLQREISVYVPYEEEAASKLDKFMDWLGAKMQGIK